MTERPQTTKTKKTTDNAYTAFSAVDELVAKPVLGSDGAAAWQTFRKDHKKTIAGGGSHAPTAPLKPLDRAAGFASWQDEQSHEQAVRAAAGSAVLHAGYTNFQPKHDDNKKVLTKKERKRIEQRLMGEDQEYFIPSKTFAGWKFDYVFTTKASHGTGYYFDGMDSFKKLRGELNEEQVLPPSTGIVSSKDDKIETTAEDSAVDSNALPKKKKRKKKAAAATLVMVHDPNNPLEQVAAAIQQKRAAAMDHSLPDGWEAACDSTTQKTYYYNRTTGERTWEKPLFLPEGWSSAQDEATGKTYYYNTTTNETRWERPTMK